VLEAAAEWAVGWSVDIALMPEC
jgi:hypothetical protein